MKSDTRGDDPLASAEIRLLNQMLSALHAKAQSGDEQAIDRVLKIIELKRRLRSDESEDDEWRM